jgi:hypothetical protein
MRSALIYAAISACGVLTVLMLLAVMPHRKDAKHCDPGDMIANTCFPHGTPIDRHGRH